MQIEKVIDRILESTSSENKRLSMLMLSVDICNVILKNYDLGEQRFEALIRNGEDEVKLKIASNPNITFLQYLDLSSSENQKISFAAKNNKSYC